MEFKVAKENAEKVDVERVPDEPRLEPIRGLRLLRKSLWRI